MAVLTTSPFSEVLVTGPGLAARADAHVAKKEEKVKRGRERLWCLWKQSLPSLILPEREKPLEIAAGNSSSELAGGSNKQRTYKYITFTLPPPPYPYPPPRSKPAKLHEDAVLSLSLSRDACVTPRDFWCSSRTPPMLHREPVERSCS